MRKFMRKVKFNSNIEILSKGEFYVKSLLREFL